MKSVCHIDDDLAAPILRLLRKLLMRGERDGEEDHFSLMSLFHRNRVAVASPIPLLPPINYSYLAFKCTHRFLLICPLFTLFRNASNTVAEMQMA